MTQDPNAEKNEQAAAETGECSAGNEAADFERKLKEAGDAVLSGSRKERERGRSAAAKEAESLKEKLAEAEDQKLRALAELENFRQRKNKELADHEKYAPMRLARDILPIWDNLGRALEAAPQEESVQGFVEGVRMVYDQFIDILAKNGVTRISAKGEKFDPNRHESIAMFPSDEPAGTVLEEARPGFMLHDRVVRPAQVVVSAARPAAASEEAPSAGEEKGE
ncbi:MAG: nucleotide exchange factor GrpE [Thermoguttaceae bacterium]|nr:nucleotide exchange factor GrpE [Thermoguttaceae bacterium]